MDSDHDKKQRLRVSSLSVVTKAVLQSPSEPVPKFLKAQNAAAEKSLMS